MISRAERTNESPISLHCFQLQSQGLQDLSRLDKAMKSSCSEGLLLCAKTVCLHKQRWP